MARQRDKFFTLTLKSTLKSETTSQTCKIVFESRVKKARQRDKFVTLTLKVDFKKRDNMKNLSDCV